MYIDRMITVTLLPIFTPLSLYGVSHEKYRPEQFPREIRYNYVPGSGHLLPVWQVLGGMSRKGFCRNSTQQGGKVRTVGLLRKSDFFTFNLALCRVSDL